MTASGRFGSTSVQMPFFRPKVSRLSRSLRSPASDSHPWPSPRLSARVARCQLKGKVHEKWGKLTNDDLDIIQGRAEQLIGRVQERYGVARAEAERQVKDWVKAEPTPTR
jgi:uncharacterized protein YjbJ (UPF0337 family)